MHMKHEHDFTIHYQININTESNDKLMFWHKAFWLNLIMTGGSCLLMQLIRLTFCLTHCMIESIKFLSLFRTVTEREFPAAIWSNADRFMCAACMSYTHRTLPDSEILTKSMQFRRTDSEDFCCCLVLPEEKKLSHGTVMVERVL